MGPCLWTEFSRHGLSQGSLPKLCRTKQKRKGKHGAEVIFYRNCAVIRIQTIRNKTRIWHS